MAVKCTSGYWTHSSNTGGQTSPVLQRRFLIQKTWSFRDVNDLSEISGPHLIDCGRTVLTGADSHGIQELIYEYFPVAVISRISGLADRFHGPFRPFLGGNDDFKFDLRKHIDVHYGSSYVIGLSLLLSASHNLRDGDAVYLDFVKGRFHIFKFVFSYNRFYLEHIFTPIFEDPSRAGLFGISSVQSVERGIRALTVLRQVKSCFFGFG